MGSPSAEIHWHGLTGGQSQVPDLFDQERDGSSWSAFRGWRDHFLFPRVRHHDGDVRLLGELFDPSPYDVGGEKKVGIEPRVRRHQSEGGFRG
eukprot:2711082-Heterocapsa_arctica.AAC.1